MKKLNIFLFKWKNEKKGYLLPRQLNGYQYEDKDIIKTIQNIRKVWGNEPDINIISDVDVLIKGVNWIKLWSDYSDLGGCYRRLKLFEYCANFHHGENCLMLDVDCQIYEDIREIVSYCTPRFLNSYDKENKNRIGGGLWFFKGGECVDICNDFKEKKFQLIEEAKKKNIVGTDQAIIQILLGGPTSNNSLGEKDGYFIARRLRKLRIFPPKKLAVIFSHGGYLSNSYGIYLRNPWKLIFEIKARLCLKQA